MGGHGLHGDPLGALAAHEALVVAGAGGVHGVIDHSWARDGWAPFDVVPATQHLDQVFTTSVVGGRGRVTGDAGSGAGNHRVWYLHPSTNWSRARITATWWGPSIWQASPVVNRPQMGFVLGAQQPNPLTDPDQWVALVVWYNIFGADNPSGLLVNGWEIDGTTVVLGNGGGAGLLGNVNRSAVVLRAEHISFGGEFSSMRVAPSWAAVITAGTPITVTGMSDPDYDLDGTVGSAAAGDINIIAAIPSAPTNPADPIAGGVLAPDPPWNATPYKVSAERVGPASVRVTQWAYGSPPPDPGDPRSVTVTVTQGSMTEFPTDAPGLHGVVVGHAHTGSYAEWGDLLLEQR